MLSFFRTNQFIANLFLIVYTIIVRFSLFFIRPEGEITISGAYSKGLYDLVSPDSLLSFFLAALLVCFQGVIINVIIARFRIGSEVSLFPGLFYILLSSAIPEFLFLSPALLGNTFLIFMLMELFSIYKKHASTGSIFNTGFWLGLSSLMHPPNMFFVILVFIAIGLLKAFKFKERLIILLGFFCTYFISGVYFFWNDGLSDFLNQQFLGAFRFLDFKQLVGLEYKIKLASFALLLLFVILNYNRYLFKKKIQSQKYINISYWYLLVAGISTLFVPSLDLTQLIVLTPTLGILLSFTFLKMSKSMAEALHFLFLVGILLVQFKGLWLF